MLILSLVQAGTISVTNLNSTYITNGGSGVEAGLEQSLQFSGTGFTEYANQNIVLDVFLENQSAWWDKTNQQWDFPVTLPVDASGGFSFNWTLPFNELVWPNATASVTIGAGQYIVAGNMRVAIANNSVQGGLFWVKRNESASATDAQGIWGDNNKIYVGYTGKVAAFNKSYAGTSYYGKDDTTHHAVIWNTTLATTGVVQEVWAESDGTYLYAVQSTAGWLRRLNATNGSVINSVDGGTGTEKYSVWGDSNYIYTGDETGVIRNYSKDLSAYSTFTSTPAISSIAYDIWADSTNLYACFANGYVYAYDLSTRQTIWYNRSTTQQCNGIFGDSEGVYSGHALGKLIKYSKTDGSVLWNITDYAHNNILNIWVNNYIYALYSDGAVVYFNKTDGTSGLFRHFARHVPGASQQGNAIYGDTDYIYTGHNLGWLFKIGQENKNFEWHPEANFWVRDLTDTWNIIIKPTKPVFADNETLAFEFMVFDNKTNPVDVTVGNLNGTYFYMRTSRDYSQWEATAVTVNTLDPRINTAWIVTQTWIKTNNLTYAACPSTHYDNGSDFYANKTMWTLNGGQWCLYQNATVPPPVYTIANGTKLPTYTLATVRPKPMINTTDASWYNILNGGANPYDNLTKYYGNEKYTWFAVFGSNNLTNALDNGVLGAVKKAGSDYEYAWSDKFGRSDYWNVGRSGTTSSTIMYARYSLAQNTTPFEFYWILGDTNGDGATPYIASGIEKATKAIANPVNITIGDDEYDAVGWTVDGSLFYHRRNISFTEPNIIERIDEPVNFTFDPLGNITSSCQDIRIVDEASNLVTFQNETCSANSINLWHFINLTQNTQKNYTVYYNSTASAPSFTLMDVTTSGTCPTQTINFRKMSLAYDTNYTKNYNWTAWGLDGTELLKFNFANTSSWVTATSVQDLYWAYNNGTGTTAVDGWDQRCIQQTGAIFTKISVNQTTMSTINGNNLDIFGTVYIFQKSGRVKIIMQPSTNITDPKDNYPAYLRYGIDTVMPQSKADGDRYNVWTDWAGRREMLDKTVLGEPLINYTSYNVNGVQTPLKATFRFPFPQSFAFNYNASQPTCMGNQLVEYFRYTTTPTSGVTLATIAEAWTHDFGICHRSLYNNITQYNTGWTMIYPDLRLYGTTYNRWVDAATYGKFYLLQNNYVPFSRIHYFYPYAGGSYTTARATLAPVNMCPDIEHNYNSYAEMLNNISQTTINLERKTSGNYSCLVNLVKMIDQRGADKAEFILTKNSTIFYGEVKRQDEPYPSVAVATGYNQTNANKPTYWYGNWFSVVTPHPYVLHGYATGGNPQFIPATSIYYESPQQYFNKHVWNESYFWDKNQTQLLAGTGVNIGPETSDARGFTCNLAAVSGATWESTTRLGWQHAGTVAVACPYSTENMKHYSYARPSYTNYISITSGGSTGGVYDFYLFGKNNYSSQAGTHNSLFDYKHYPDGISTDPNDINDLNETERHMNKQPWMCEESSRNNRSFCVAYSSKSSFILSAQAGAANEQAAFGQDYSSAIELDRFLFYTNTRWTGATYYPYDYITYRYVYPYLVAGEFDVNLLYAGNGTSDNKIAMVFPDAWKAMMQGYLQGFDAGNRFWIYFNQDTRQYSPGQNVTINGTLFKDDARLSGVAVSLTILKSDATFITNAVKTTDSSGQFNLTYTLPTTLTSGLYYIQADYNNGEILNKFGFKITTNVVTISTDKAAYSRGDTATTSFNIKDYLTNAYKDPDQTELRYYSPDGSVMRCAKYPSTATVTNCIYNITRTTTGYYSDSVTLSSNATLGTYSQKITTTDSGITADFYNTFSVSEFTGWIDVSINNTISGTSFTSNITTTNKGSTQVTKTVEITVPTSCGYITSVTNSTGSVSYNIYDLSSACKVYWDVTLAGSASTWFLIQATLQSSGSAYPTIELSASTPIATSTLSSIGALVKSSTGIPVNCDGDLKITIRNLSDSSSISGNMTNFGTGMYNYSWTTPATASVFYVNASCAISGTSYTGFTTISTQNVSTPTTIDYNEIANYVWNYASRNLTYYNQSIAENIKNCLKDSQCSGWWINSTLTQINTTINTINSTTSQIKSDTETLLNYVNCNQTNEVCTRLQNILNNATDIQSRVYSLNTSQIPNLQTSINNTYTDTQYIRTNMATASALADMQTNVTWLLNNVATQTNITLINSKLDTINSTINTIKTQTDCSSPANSVLCTYLNNTNSSVTDIKNNWGSYTAENIITRLTELNTTTQNTYSYILTNISTQTNVTEILSQINNVQNNITFVKNNMFYQGNATGSFLVDYLSTVFSEPSKKVELWVLTRDLLGNSKTVSEAICDIRKNGVWIANATTTINSGGVYASWNVTQNISFGAYYWNCTLTGSTVNLQVPFFISGEFGITSLVSASPKYPNENAIVEATFANQNGSVEPDTINLTIWKPNYITIWYTASKTNFSRNGEIWSWTQMIESSPTTGTYYVQMEATYNEIKDSKTTQFRIATGGPYMVFLECPSSSNVGENLVCTVKIQDEGEAATESTSTVWVDTDNDGIADAGEPQSSFSKQTTPLQNVTQSVSINVPSSYSTGLYVVRVDTSYANSGQPNSGASDSVTFGTASAGEDSGTGGGTGGGSSSASSKSAAPVTGKTIEHPEHLMDISTRVLDEYKIVNPGGKVLIEVTLYNLGTEEIKDVIIKYCIETNERAIVKCSEETIAVYTKLQIVKDFLISQNTRYGEYFIKTEATYNNNSKAYSEISFEVKGGTFNVQKNLMINYLLPIGLGMVILILLIVIISIYKKRRKTKEIKLKLIPLETKLRQLDELKGKGAINKEAYISEKNKLLSRFKEIAKKSKIFVSLIFVGIVISTVMLISNRKIIGMVIENIDSSINKKLIIFVASILVIIALFLVLRKKIPCYFKSLGEFVDYLWSKHKKNPTNSVRGLINKKVYSENGFYIGKVKEIILGKNRIETLKIKINKKYKSKAKGIIINYKYVKNVGEIIIIKEKVLEYINDFKS